MYRKDHNQGNKLSSFLLHYFGKLHRHICLNKKINFCFFFWKVEKYRKEQHRNLEGKSRSSLHQENRKIHLHIILLK